MDHIQKWLADHAALVDAAKWCIILLLGWFTGFFRYISHRFKRATVGIVLPGSRAYQVAVPRPEGGKAERTAFMIDIAIENPTTEPAVLRHLTLSYKPLHPFRRFTKEFGCTTYPAPVRMTIGEITKFPPVFFSTFPLGISAPSHDGVLHAKGYQQGYILVVSETFGNYSPKVTNNKVRVRVHGYFTDGRTHSHTVYIPLVASYEVLEEYVPGITKHIEEPGTRNIFPKF
jgi:hypothetical protein